jgi:SAM-dependent methyltransferase
MTYDERSGTAKAQELWAREADERVRYGRGFHWVESPLVMAYIQDEVSCNSHLDWLAYSYQKYLKGREKQADRILSLGSGGGALERGLCRLGFNGRIDAYDFSEGAVTHARQLAAEEHLDNIYYFVGDLNEAEFPRETYDVVYSSGALHHIVNLERLLDQVKFALKDDGLLIINEYVGPFQLQWTAKQTKIIDDLLHLLPPKYTRHVSNPERVKDFFSGPSSIREMNANDPSESVRSDEIIPLIQARFSIKEHKNFGGTILHMLLQDIAGNFDPADPTYASFLNLLIYIEKLLIQEKVLESDFVFLVAEKKPRPFTASQREPIDLAAELRARDVRIRNMNERLRQSEKHAEDLQIRLDQLALLPNPPNLMHERGAAWELVQRYRSWKERKLPVGSRRRRAYDAFMQRVRKQLGGRHENS